MTHSVRRIVRFTFMAAGFALVPVTTLAQSHPAIAGLDRMQWQAAPPMLPPGAQISVLEGDPGSKGLVTLRLKFPANYVVPPHWHSMTEDVTVLSGAFYIGMGDAVDRPGSQMLRPGGFVSLPAKMHHYAWVKAETVVQINLEGPFDIFYVNPVDDPQHKPGKPAAK